MVDRPEISRLGWRHQYDFWTEFHGDGDSYRFSARWVARAYCQRPVFYHAGDTDRSITRMGSTFRTTPQVGWLLFAVKSVVIAIIAQALWILGRKVVKGPLTMAVGLCVIAFFLRGLTRLLCFSLAV
jgi:hypothetical protein